MHPAPANPALVTLYSGRGKVVKAARLVADKHQRLVALSRARHYWALVAVKRIESLTQGRNHDYVFIPGDLAEKDFAQVTVVLPGCTALVERRSDDVYIICALEISDEFEQAQADLETQTGMYVAKANQGADRHERDSIVIEPCAQDHMNEKALNQNAMVIGALNYANASSGAKEAAKIIKDTYGPSGARIVKGGFHYFHHSFKAKSKTLRNRIPIAHLYAPSDAHNCRAAAMILAEAVRNAPESTALDWLCEGAGAITAAQAMTLLGAEGIKLENHTLRLYDAPVNLAAIPIAAAAVGIKVESSHLGKQGLRRPIAAATYFRACHLIRRQQLASENQQKSGSAIGYVAGHLAHADALAGSFLNGVNMISLSAGAIGLAAGSPQVATIAGAVAAANTAYKISAGTIKGANKLMKDAAPKIHDKIKDRLK